jgi:hypothetical protein
MSRSIEEWGFLQQLLQYICPGGMWGPSSLLFNGYRGFFPQGGKLKQKGREADHWPSSSARSRMVEFHFHISLHGTVLNKLGGGQLYLKSSNNNNN